MNRDVQAAISSFQVSLLGGLGLVRGPWPQHSNLSIKLKLFANEFVTPILQGRTSKAQGHVKGFPLSTHRHRNVMNRHSNPQSYCSRQRLSTAAVLPNCTLLEVALKCAIKPAARDPSTSHTNCSHSMSTFRKRKASHLGTKTVQNSR